MTEINIQEEAQLQAFKAVETLVLDVKSGQFTAAQAERVLAMLMTALNPLQPNNEFLDLVTQTSKWLDFLLKPQQLIQWRLRRASTDQLAVISLNGSSMVSRLPGKSPRTLKFDTETEAGAHAYNVVRTLQDKGFKEHNSDD